MKLKLKERFTGTVEAAPPADDAADALVVKGARLRALLDGAATESGNRVSNLHEQGIRPVLASVRLKARLAAGEPEGRARRRIEDALDAQEDEVAQLTVETREEDQRRAAEERERKAAEFLAIAANWAQLVGELRESPAVREFCERLTPFHARALAIRARLIAACGNDGASRIPEIGRYKDMKAWTLSELAGLVVREHIGEPDTAPDKRIWPPLSMPTLGVPPARANRTRY